MAVVRYPITKKMAAFLDCEREKYNNKLNVKIPKYKFPEKLILKKLVPLELHPKKRMRNKRASIQDIAFLLVIGLGLGIFFLVAGFVIPQITNAFQDSVIGDNNASNTALQTSENLTNRFDNLFLVVFIGMSIAILITAFFIESSPILAPIYMFGLGILIMVAVIGQYIYAQFASSSTFQSTAINTPIMNLVLSNLVFIAIGVGVLSVILIFAKPRRPNGF